MPTELWIAMATAAAATGWAAAYFGLDERREARRSEAEATPQEVSVEVDGAFRPERLEVFAGQPIVLVFEARARGLPEWDDVEFPYGRLYDLLPEGGSTALHLGALEAGEYAFFGRDRSLRGTLVVRGE